MKTMITKTAFVGPVGLMMLAATWACGGAPTTSEGEELATPPAGAAAEQANPTEQANIPVEQKATLGQENAKPGENAAQPGALPGENVGKTQQPWFAYPGYGYAYPYYGGVYGAYPYGYGYGGAWGYPYGYGFGIGRAWGWGASTTCINGFCY